MFHAISAWLNRQASNIRDTGLSRDNAIAGQHGWQTRQIRPGTWQYRDPRLPRPAAPSPVTAGDPGIWQPAS